MNKKIFWQLIDNAKTGTDGDIDKVYDNLFNILFDLDAPEIVIWGKIFNEYQNLSYKEKLWAAPYVIDNGCSDDGFDYFRGWLTAQGKTVFMNALKDPDSLVDVEEAKGGELYFAKVLSVASKVYFKKTGNEEELYATSLSDEVKSTMLAEIQYAEDMDYKWEDDELERIVPKLCKKFNFKSYGLIN